MFNKSLRLGSVALFALIALIGIGLIGSSGPVVKTVSGYQKGQPDPSFQSVSVTIHYQGGLKQTQSKTLVPFDITCLVSGNFSDVNSAKLSVQYKDANANGVYDQGEEILSTFVTDLKYQPKFTMTGFSCGD